MTKAEIVTDGVTGHGRVANVTERSHVFQGGFLLFRLRIGHNYGNKNQF